MRKLRDEKPVIASVDVLAASAAYQISVASTEIFAKPASFIGNIGVPKSLDSPAMGSWVTAAMIDVGLLALFAIQRDHHRTLSFRCSCRLGMCGTCAVSINGVPRLACKTRPLLLGSQTVTVATSTGSAGCVQPLPCRSPPPAASTQWKKSARSTRSEFMQHWAWRYTREN